MEQKLLKVFKLADKLNTKQSKVYAEANDSQKLEFIIRSKKDYSYIEKCEITITEDSEIQWDNIISLFETFVGGVSYE